MIRFRNYSSLVLVASVLAACSGSGNAVSAPPVPADATHVADNVSDTSNDDSFGKGVSETDADTDGLPTDRDLCPGTAEGDEVDGNGCSEAQRETDESAADDPAQSDDSDDGAPDTDNVENWTPEKDGQAASNGFASFVLDPTGPNPILLKTLTENVVATSTGFQIDGTLLIDVPGDEQIALLKASVTLDYDADRSLGLQRVDGSARLPFPASGAFSGVEMDDIVQASVGYDRGENIDADGPFSDERKYLFFTFTAGLSASVNELEIAAGGGKSVTMALDPSDPAFFLNASLDGSLGPINHAGLGFSAGGHLSFEPRNTWGLSPSTDPASELGFQGHLWVAGEVDLNDLGVPLALAGETVYDLDPNDDGKTLFEDPADGFQIGSNSELAMSIDAGVLGLSIAIAEGTLVGHIGERDGSASFSGYIAAGNGWMPEEVPVENTQRLRAAGFVSSNLSDSYLTAEGAIRLDAGTLGDWVDLDLEDLAVAQARLEIDANGVLVQGLAAASITPVIELKGDVELEAFFSGEPEEWYLTLDGRLEVKGVDLSSNAQAILDHTGLFVSGSFKTPLARIDMSGNITKHGVDIQGSAAVTIPIVAGKEIIEIVTNAAVCGTEFVTDAGLCGTKTVQNGLLCGTEFITDGAVCGWEPVQSATLCGTSVVTSSAHCGTRVVTDAAQCGMQHFSGWGECAAQCVGSFFGDCDCWKPASCSVSNTCEIANSCELETSCEVDAHCEIADTCERVATCENKVTIPEFDYGSFEGKVSVQIGDSGLGGTVSGEYCPTGGSCISLGGGRLKLSSGKPEACISVAGLGQFCAPI